MSEKRLDPAIAVGWLLALVAHPLAAWHLLRGLDRLLVVVAYFLAGFIVTLVGLLTYLPVVS